MGSVFAVNNNKLGPVATSSGTSFLDLYPIGSIIISLADVPYSWHECDGSEYDTTAYPDLFKLLKSDKLPDLREATAVGAGQNTSDTITTHDAFSLLEFKDDSYQSHIHNITNGWRIRRINSSTSGRTDGDAAGTKSPSYVATSGAVSSVNEVQPVTIGKSIGVRYIIRMG